jgi:hypothetical protein
MKIQISLSNVQTDTAIRDEYFNKLFALIKNHARQEVAPGMQKDTMRFVNLYKRLDSRMSKVDLGERPIADQGVLHITPAESHTMKKLEKIRFNIQG